jgi:hypothetical protein
MSRFPIDESKRIRIFPTVASEPKSRTEASTDFFFEDWNCRPLLWPSSVRYGKSRFLSAFNRAVASFCRALDCLGNSPHSGD